MGKPYRLVFLDIETAPNVSYTWGKWQQDVVAFEREWYLMSFSWRWADEKKTNCLALPDFPLFKRNPFDDSRLVKELWKIFDEADLIVAHNLVGFDAPKANSRFILNGLKPPAPYKMVDTLLIARKHFKFNDNKLSSLCTSFGFGGKMDTGGFKLWLKCMQGDMTSWARMKKYNVQDVVLLEKLYNHLRPWYPEHPNISLASGDTNACPACGSNRVEQRGWRFLKSYKAKRYVCLNPKCGRWSTGSRVKLGHEVLA